MAPVVPDPKKIKVFRSEAAFEAWLRRNHARETEIWVRIYKKGAGRRTVTNAQALDAALCWGWIDGILWAADQGSNKLLAYDADGHFLYSWGTFGTCQGCQWGVHGFATDKEGNLYTAEVRTGRVQKYTPRKGANPDFLVGKPWPGVW